MQLCHNAQMHLSIGVLRKRCSENMQQICNLLEITLQHGCSVVNLLYILRTSFSKNTYGGLVLNAKNYFGQIWNLNDPQIYFRIYCVKIVGEKNTFPLSNVLCYETKLSPSSPLEVWRWNLKSFFIFGDNILNRFLESKSIYTLISHVDEVIKYNLVRESLPQV